MSTDRMNTNETTVTSIIDSYEAAVRVNHAEAAVAEAEPIELIGEIIEHGENGHGVTSDDITAAFWQEVFAAIPALQARLNVTVNPTVWKLTP